MGGRVLLTRIAFSSAVRLPGPSLVCGPTGSLYVFVTDRSFGFDLVNCSANEVVIPHVQTTFTNGGRVSLDWRTEGGRIVVRVARGDRSFRRVTKTLLRSSSSRVRVPISPNLGSTFSVQQIHDGRQAYG